MRPQVCPYSLRETGRTVHGQPPSHVAWPREVIALGLLGTKGGRGACEPMDGGGSTWPRCSGRIALKG